MGLTSLKNRRKQKSFPEQEKCAQGIEKTINGNKKKEKQ